MRRFVQLVVAAVLGAAGCGSQAAESGSASAAASTEASGCVGDVCPCDGKRELVADLKATVQSFVSTPEGLVVNAKGGQTASASFHRIPWNGGDAARIVDASKLEEVSSDAPAIFGDELYFVADYKTIYAAKIGSDAPPEKVQERLTDPRGLVANDQYLVFRVSDKKNKNPDDISTTIIALPRTTRVGAAQPEDKPPPKPAPTKGKTPVEPPAAPARKELLKANVAGLWIDARYVYVAAVDEGVLRIDLASGERTTLTKEPAIFLWPIEGALAFDSRKSIKSVPLAGGEAKDIATRPYWTLMTDPDFDGKSFVYFTAASTKSETKGVQVGKNAAIRVQRDNKACSLDIVQSNALNSKVLVRNNFAYWSHDSQVYRQKLD